MKSNFKDMAAQEEEVYVDVKLYVKVKIEKTVWGFLFNERVLV